MDVKPRRPIAVDEFNTDVQDTTKCQLVALPQFDLRFGLRRAVLALSDFEPTKSSQVSGLSNTSTLCLRLLHPLKASTWMFRGHTSHSLAKQALSTLPSSDLIEGVPCILEISTYDPHPNPRLANNHI